MKTPLSLPVLLLLVFLLLFLHRTLVSFSVKTEVGTTILACVCCVGVYFLKSVWVNQWVIREKLRAQGINGPTPSLFYGNVWEMNKIQASATATVEDDNEFVAHDYTSTLFPYFEQWRKQYGPVYTYSSGKKQHLYINDPELVKEMSHCISGELGKPSYVTKRLSPLLGNGILRSNGQFWEQQRKIVAPELFKNKVKGMVGLMVESAESLADKWEASLESEGGETAEVKADEDLRWCSADVIAKACFGSSYLKGKEIFSKLTTLQKAIISNQSFLFGSHASTFHFQLKNNIQILEKEIETLIWETVKRRECDCRRDLMQLLLEGAIDTIDKESSKRFIVDNCKNIYFAGHESTAVAASWCLMMLALHPSWQARIRSEVGHLNINADSLSKLKTVTMVIQEVMRLYPPAAFVSREALQETRIGHIVVPKGVCLWTLIPTLHRDPNIWGPDANEFKPERFKDGISKACKLPQAYIPFGLEPRLCLGRNFALVQLKVVIAIIVSKFTLALSPNYRHSPAYKMIVEPGQGVNLLIQRCGK